MADINLETTNQFLTFTLSNESYAIEIGKVREVLDFTTITKVPQMPDYMLGVINLRGSVVPIVDLRVKFEMKGMERTIKTSIVILEIALTDETVVVGAIVDAVQEVIEIEPDHIEPPPRMGTRLRTEFLKGMGKKNDKFIIILDIDRVFSTKELSLVQSAGNA